MAETEEERDVWSLLEEHDQSVDETAALYSWSLNYDPGKGPFAVFLDLIGWSMDNLGENIGNYADLPAPFGYVEVDHLAKALSEYALNPSTVLAFVDELMEAEGR